MSRNFELISKEGYAESLIQYPVIGLSVFPAEDVDFNLPGGIDPTTGERDRAVCVLRVFDDEYAGSLEMISGGRIDITEGGDNCLSLNASLDLGNDQRDIQWTFHPVDQLYAILVERLSKQNLNIVHTPDNDTTKQLTVLRQGACIARIAYTKRVDGSTFNITSPVRPDKKHDDILLGCELWAVTHQAIANAYNTNVHSQMTAYRNFFIGRTSYGTASETQVALLRELGTHNLPLPEGEKLGFGTDVQGGLLHLYEDRLSLESIDFKKLAKRMIKNRKSKEKTISQGEIVMALQEQVDSHRHDE